MAIRSIITKDDDYTYSFGVTRSFPSTNGVTFFIYLNILRQDLDEYGRVFFNIFSENDENASRGYIYIDGAGSEIIWRVHDDRFGYIELMRDVYSLQEENYLAFSIKIENNRANIVAVKDRLQIYSNEISPTGRYFLTPLVRGSANEVENVRAGFNFKCMDIIPAYMTSDEIIQIWDDVFSYASYSDKIKLVQEVVKQGINPADYNLLRSSLKDERDLFFVLRGLKR